ncbi:MAG: hypothetical protein WA364_00270 [Candidatus Nitrosopolaris sp.]
MLTAVLINDRFYSQMEGTFIGMARVTPEKFQFSRFQKPSPKLGAIIFFEDIKAMHEEMNQQSEVYSI